jgi:hypothetical protein
VLAGVQLHRPDPDTVAVALAQPAVTFAQAAVPFAQAAVPFADPAVALSVPLVVEAKAALNWDEAH